MTIVMISNLRVNMWVVLFWQNLFLMFSASCALGRLCFVIVAFPG